jgi:3-hydroxybutyryl-CoA dehydrogenase
MVALPLKNNQAISSTHTCSFISAGLDLLVKGVADVHTIDKTWMVATGLPTGPFVILDVVDHC